MREGHTPSSSSSTMRGGNWRRRLRTTMLENFRGCANFEKHTGEAQRSQRPKLISFFEQFPCRLCVLSVSAVNSPKYFGRGSAALR